jgi:hypothetical protein
MSDVPTQAVSRFLRFGEGEVRGREYYICRANYRRYPARVILVIAMVTIVLGAGGYFLGRTGQTAAGLVVFALPEVLMLLYFALRRLKTTHGFAAATGDRLLYYQYNEHPTINYHSVQQVHIRDISAIRLYVEKTWLTHEFVLTVWTPSAAALEVGATKHGGGAARLFRFPWIFVTWLFLPVWLMLRVGGFFFAGRSLEPGPDADEFAQQISTLIAQRRAEMGLL